MTHLIRKKEMEVKLLRVWRSGKLHKAWLANDVLFPYQINLAKPGDKTLLHQFDEIRSWIAELTQVFTEKKGLRIVRKDFNYSTMGKQSLPVAIEFKDMQAMARFLGKWQEWQQFCSEYTKISAEFPELKEWLKHSPANILKYTGNWPKLLNVCHYFIRNPQPDCYIRELDIKGVDTKFVERHKPVLKNLLDILLPDSAIHKQYDKLSVHGFEKRFGLRYEQPRVHFRILDKNMAADLAGVTDLEIPVDQFSQLDLLCERIFITENKTNGLAFPEVNNAIVIFGLGYGIQMLKTVSWVNQCQLYYWGDIDTHGFAILSQARSYFPKIKSWLMDEPALLHCKAQWGEEPAEKSHQADVLPFLTEPEQALYQKLKNDHWQASLRLEQEKIPFEYWETKLKSLK